MFRFSSIKLKLTVFWILALCGIISCSHPSHIFAPLVHPSSGDRINIYYTVAGVGEPTILFVHGWSCDHTFWNSQTAYFSKNYRVVTLDLPGHGKSSAPHASYTIDLFADSILSVMDELNISRVFLVGHSMGYPVARRFIQKFPEKSVGLCIVDGAYLRVPRDPEKRKDWEQQHTAFVENFYGTGRDEFLKQFLDSLFVEQSPPLLKKSIMRTMTGTPAYVANSAMADMMQKENWEEYRLDIPALAVYAVSPDLPNDNKAFLNSLYPDLEYHEWNRVGHFLMIEKPEEFNIVLSRYLKRKFPPP